MTILPNAIYRFNVISIKLLMAFSTELEQKKIINHRETQIPWIAEAVLRKKNELEESTFLTSDYTTKLLFLRQYGPGTKTEI